MDFLLPPHSVAKPLESTLSISRWIVLISCLQGYPAWSWQTDKGSPENRPGRSSFSQWPFFQGQNNFCMNFTEWQSSPGIPRMALKYIRCLCFSNLLFTWFVWKMNVYERIVTQHNTNCPFIDPRTSCLLIPVQTKHYIISTKRRPERLHPSARPPRDWRKARPMKNN